MVSLFIDASEEQIKLAKEIGADIVEIHTGEYCRKINYHEDGQNELERIKEAAIFADEIGLELHLGHGITFDSVKELSKIKEVKEFNIGHFIISESVFIGLQNSIKKFKEIKFNHLMSIYELNYHNFKHFLNLQAKKSKELENLTA